MKTYLWIIIILQLMIMNGSDEVSLRKVRCKSKFSTPSTPENPRVTSTNPSKFHDEYFNNRRSIDRKFHLNRPKLEIITKSAVKTSTVKTTSMLKYPTMASTPSTIIEDSTAANISSIIHCPSMNALYFPSTMVGTKSKRGEMELKEKFSNLINLKKVSIGAAFRTPAFVYEVSFVTSPKSNLSAAFGDQLPLMKMFITSDSNNVTLKPEVMTQFVGLEVTSDDDEAEVFIKYLHIGVIPDICCEIVNSFTLPSSSSSQPGKKCTVDQRCINLSVSEIDCIDI